jgi:hypothetical protein
MTVIDQLAPQKVEQTMFALFATWLAKGTKNIVGDFPSITVVGGYRTFVFEGVTYQVAARAASDLILSSTVNIYFGNHTPDLSTAKPQRITLPVIVHIAVSYGDRKMLAEKLAMRMGSYLEMAMEGLGAKIQVCDLSTNPPTPTANRFVSWARKSRMRWREAGNPTIGVETNRIGTRELRYTK